MKPGRGLDALVAKKVMGFNVIKINQKEAREALDVPSGITAPAGKLELIIKFLEGVMLCDGLERDIPHYSTDISDAWEVVEKIHSSTFDWSRGYGYYVESESITKTSTDLKINMYKDHKGWEVRFMDMHNNTFVCAYEAKTAALAICLAALRAVVVEI